MASHGDIDQIIKQLYDEMVLMYKDMTFKTPDFHDCIIRLMECVEIMPKLVGADKKKIVKGVLLLIINKLKIDESEKKKIIYILTNDIIDIIIDLVIKMTRNSCKINTHLLRSTLVIPEITLDTVDAVEADIAVEEKILTMVKYEPVIPSYYSKCNIM